MNSGCLSVYGATLNRESFVRRTYTILHGKKRNLRYIRAHHSSNYREVSMGLGGFRLLCDGMYHFP